MVLPFHNAESTLQTCLQSLALQTFPLHQLEVLAVNDHSTDNSCQVVEQYRSLLRSGDCSLSLKLLASPRRGIVPALNYGLSKAQGEYIARMDADDESLPERLEKQVRWLDTCPKTGLVATQVIFGGERSSAGGYADYVDWQNSMITAEEISLRRFVESPFAHPSVMFRRELIDAHGIYEESHLPEDYELWLRWMEAGVVVEKIAEPLLIWNDPPDRLSRHDPRCSVDAFYECRCRYLAQWLRKRFPTKGAETKASPSIYLCGAGRITRKRFRLLEELGWPLSGFIDIDPSKAGKEVDGRPVIHTEEIPPANKSERSLGENAFIISGVGSRGARELIQKQLDTLGYREGVSYLLAS